MRNLYLVLVILLFGSICTAQEATPLPPSERGNERGYVQNLTVEDYPYDDGSGLVIKFSTLPLDARIIEYRIYRGVSPDSLYYQASIEVDPTIGVPGGELIFMDRDFRTFVDIESPRRQRAEKGYPKTGPIFRALPRDLNVIGPMFDQFDFLTIIDKNTYYRKTQKHFVENEDGATLLGGLKIEEFEAILANVLPGKPYYYTVIAVNETGRLLPHAPIVEGIATDNKPAPAPAFHAVMIVGANNNSPIQLNFEFELPLFVDDIAQHSIYMIEKSQLPALDDFRDYMHAVETWNTQVTLGDTNAVMPEEIDNPGIPIKVIPTSYPYPTPTFAEVQCQEDQFATGYNFYIENAIDGSPIPFNPDKINDYLFYITMDDYTGFQAVGTPVSASVATSADLPTLPAFVVRDKPNDKGDINEIIIGRPLVMLTQFTFNSTKDRTRLTAAYTYNPIPDIKVRSITFIFHDNNDQPMFTKSKPLVVTEHYIDNIFNFRLPDLSFIDEGFRVYMSFNAPGTEIHNKIYLYQDVRWDEELMSLRPHNLFSRPQTADGDMEIAATNFEELLNFRYTVIKQAQNSASWREASKSTPYINTIDDVVSYEKYIFKGINSFDLSTNRILVDTYIDVGYDEELGTTVMTSLFYDEFMIATQNELDKYNEILAENPDDPVALYYSEFYPKMLEMQETHPYLAAANKIESQRGRISAIRDKREKLRRTFRYKLVKTDGRGLFTISDIYRNYDGGDTDIAATTNGYEGVGTTGEWIFPTPDWFDVKTIPMLVATLVFGFFVLYFSITIKRGKHTFIRPIAGLEEVDNAIGRATEMGRPVLYVPGLSSIEDVATLAGLAILGHITKKTAEYDSRIIVPVCDYIVLPIAQQIVKESHTMAGRPDSYNSNDIFFVASGQFAYVAGVNGVMIREKTATNFYMGMFWAEALIMTETGNQTGAIQVAGTDALTQIPFFITTCDYTLIGEELYGAAAYLTRDPMIVSTLKSQDYTKLLIIFCIIVGSILSTFNLTFFINAFPAE